MPVQINVKTFQSRLTTRSYSNAAPTVKMYIDGQFIGNCRNQISLLLLYHKFLPYYLQIFIDFHQFLVDFLFFPDISSMHGKISFQLVLFLYIPIMNLAERDVSKFPSNKSLCYIINSFRHSRNILSF